MSCSVAAGQFGFGFLVCFGTGLVLLGSVCLVNSVLVNSFWFWVFGLVWSWFSLVWSGLV